MPAAGSFAPVRGIVRRVGRALALVLLSLLPVAPVNGQPRPATPALAACVTRAGGEDAAAFLAFDAELRAALAAGDASLVTLLTAFPLRITDGTARVLVADAASLAGRGAQGLPAAVRAEVSAAPLDALICRFDGIGYAGGQLGRPGNHEAPCASGLPRSPCRRWPRRPRRRRRRSASPVARPRSGWSSTPRSPARRGCAAGPARTRSPRRPTSTCTAACRRPRAPAPARRTCAHRRRQRDYALGEIRCGRRRRRPARSAG